MMTNYRSRSDMHELARQVSGIEQRHEPAAVAFITDNDLMRPQWWIRLLLWIARKRGRNTFAIWCALEAKAPGMCRELINSTATWIAGGRDRTTKNAAGGFNQVEVDLMRGFLAGTTTRGTILDRG